MSINRTIAYMQMFASLAFALGTAASPPAIPIGLDAYRMWDHWDYLRIGERAYMHSTYDRGGGNESADASHFLYQQADDFNVTLDVQGPGILYFARYNHWHGSPWHYEVDGTDHIVQETSTANPNKPVENSVFVPSDAFPNPLTWTWSVTKGADLSWVPIAFEKSFRMGYSRTHYGTGYYIYHQFVPGTRLSRPLRAWDGKSRIEQDVLELLNRAGTPLFTANEANTKRGVVKIDNIKAIRPGENEIATIHSAGARTIRALEFSAPRAKAESIEGLNLKIYWDGRKTPSVDAPLCLFFGAGTFHNCDNREYLVKAFLVFVRFDESRMHMACYFPMPFFDNARIVLENRSNEIVTDFQIAVAHEPYHGERNQAGYFHATYKDFPQPEPGKDIAFLDTQGLEGAPDWSGHFVGMTWIFSHNAVLNTLEGDPRFFFDDSQSPQCYGTGTEEWGGGGDYWGGRNMTLPFVGHPCGVPKPENAIHPQDKIESAYRFLLADLMPFGRRAELHLEHGGTNESTEHYQTLAYWYGLPYASLVKTDEFKIGDTESEKAHNYSSPDASPPETILSRYEWGIDTRKALNGDDIVVFPAHEETGRHTTGTSEFSMALTPKNEGVMLRRTLDYSYPNQRAEVYVADVSPKTPKWKLVGIWYLAGSNTCVYSNPKDELGETQHVVQTSNRRFRDDEFLIGKYLTDGRSTLRVRVKFTPVFHDLFPGHPFPIPTAWSELRYKAYCFVMPSIPTH